MSKVTALYHIVFATKNREMTISETYREDVYRFIWKIIKDRNCVLLRIGGVPNHIHMIVNINPRVALSDLMEELKSKSSIWMKRDGRFNGFNGWCKEYFAETVAWKDKESVIEYIKNQKEHHGFETAEDEFRKLYANNAKVFHDNDLN